MLWILIALTVIVSFFSIHGIYAQEEISPEINPFQNNDSEGMSLESVEFFRTLYFAKLTAVINESIQSLPDDVFSDPTNKDDFKEILVSGDDNIYDLFSKSNVFYFDLIENFNNFYEAATKLSELKTRMDSSIGGNPSDDWIIGKDSQKQILEMIDFTIDEIKPAVGGEIVPRSIEDYDEDYREYLTETYQGSAKHRLGYLCYSESVKKSPYEVRPNLDIPECQIWLDKSFSPIKQITMGIAPDKIQCKEGLELIFKSTDGSPACVKPRTAQKLIERGWADSQYRTLATKINTDEIEKIWMEFFPVSCLAFDCSDDFLMGKSIEPKNNFNINLFSGHKNFQGNNWDSRLQINSNIIKDGFMKKFNIHIFDVKFYPTVMSVCEWGECEDKYSLYLKVSESDVDKITELGFMISTEDALNYVDTKQFWTFIPVQGYSCGDVDCKFVNGNSNCPSTLRGYLVKENNELVTPHERFLLDQVEIDYNQCLT